LEKKAGWDGGPKQVEVNILYSREALTTLKTEHPTQAELTVGLELMSISQWDKRIVEIGDQDIVHKVE
jgi:hypothetical protein